MNTLLDLCCRNGLMNIMQKNVPYCLSRILLISEAWELEWVNNYLISQPTCLWSSSPKKKKKKTAFGHNSQLR